LPIRIVGRIIITLLRTPGDIPPPATDCLDSPVLVFAVRVGMTDLIVAFGRHVRQDRVDFAGRERLAGGADDGAAQ
jgi:hypothetical protein